MIAAIFAVFRYGCYTVACIKPSFYIVMIILLVPQQSCKCLALNVLLVVRVIRTTYCLIKFIRLSFSCLKNLLEFIRKWVFRFYIGQAQVKLFGMPGFYITIINR